MQCGNSNVASSPTSADSALHYDTPSSVTTSISPSHDSDTKINKHIGSSEDNLNSGRRRPVQSFLRAGRLHAPPPLQIPPRTAQTYLSPTAEIFTPIAHSNGHVFPRTPTLDNNVAVPVGPEDNRNSPVSQLLAHSMPDMSPYISQSLLQALQTNPGVIGQPFPHVHSSFIPESRSYHVNIRLDPTTIYKEGNFTVDEPYARAFTALNINTSPGQLAAMFAPTKFHSLDYIDTRSIAQGNFSVSFTDVRDAKQAWALTKSAAGASMIIKLSPTAFAQKKNLPSGSVPANEGEYVVRLIPKYGQRSQTINVGELRSILLNFGDLKALHTINSDIAITTVRVEWCDIVHGVSARQSLRNARLPNGDMVQIDLHSYPMTDFETPRNSGHPHPLLPSSSPLWENVTRNTNHVDIDRILAGADVRTTIMLRNIPNRINQDALKALLDQTSRGDYDFMYLRIDFANNCNVGYAFINFVDPAAIVPFARVRAGRRWNVFNSDKIAEISYATIQGRDCLIQKFRNSSVMLEQGSFRPKLFRTGRGPEAGMEEPFPKPDNVSKLRRSCENAAHIGLYTTPSSISPNYPLIITAPKNQAAGGVFTAPAPNRAIFLQGYPLTPITPILYPEEHYLTAFPSRLYAPREGQAHRERQRRQHSQYDRGTPGAEYEARLRSMITTPPSSAKASHRDLDKDDSLFSFSEIRNVMGQLFYTPEREMDQEIVKDRLTPAVNVLI